MTSTNAPATLFASSSSSSSSGTSSEANDVTGPIQVDDFFPLTLPVSTLGHSRELAAVILALERVHPNQIAAFLRQRFLGSHTASVCEFTLDPKCRVELIKHPNKTHLLMQIPKDDYTSESPPLPKTQRALIGMLNQSVIRDDPLEAAYFSRDMILDYVLVGLKRDETTKELLGTYKETREATKLLDEERVKLLEIDAIIQNSDKKREADYRKQNNLGRKVSLMDHLQDVYQKHQRHKELFDEQISEISRSAMKHVTAHGLTLADMQATDARGNCISLETYLGHVPPEDMYPVTEAILNPKKQLIRLYYHSDVPPEALFTPTSVNLKAWVSAQNAAAADYRDVIEELSKRPDASDEEKYNEALAGMTMPERHVVPLTFELGIDEVDTFVQEVIKRQGEMGYSIRNAMASINEDERNEKLRVDHAKKYVALQDK